LRPKEKKEAEPVEGAGIACKAEEVSDQQDGRETDER
jgi:hypothetical protein